MIDLGLSAAKPQNPAADGLIRDTDGARFEQDVLRESMTRPVIVDFWATWCGPCRQLMPLLEKAVTAAKGAVVLVKIDIDKNPELATALRVQSVPMVYAFYKGQPVDGFMGAQPESQIKAFVERLAQMGGGALANEEAPAADVSELIAQGEKFLMEEKYEDAIAAYSNALDAAPEHAGALAGIGWALVAQKEREGVADIVSSLNEDQKKDPALSGLARLIAAGEGAAAADMDALLAAVAAKPKDLPAKYDLAHAQIATLDLAAAIDTLIDLTRIDREWNGQQARQLLIDLFDMLGPKHPLTSQGRRKLSAILFS